MTDQSITKWLYKLNMVPKRICIYTSGFLVWLHYPRLDISSSALRISVWIFRTLNHSHTYFLRSHDPDCLFLSYPRHVLSVSVSNLLTQARPTHAISLPIEGYCTCLNVHYSESKERILKEIIVVCIGELSICKVDVVYSVHSIHI